MSTYQVIVGNIGTVWEDTNEAEALRQYGQWKAQTKERGSRAWLEAVTLMRDGEPWYEHPSGSLNDD